MRKATKPAILEPLLRTKWSYRILLEKGRMAAKTLFYADFFGFLLRKYCLCASTLRNYVNLPKKLLPLTDLTITINSLVVRINGCQNEALNSRGV
jgi:hypothetical protein